MLTTATYNTALDAAIPAGASNAQLSLHNNYSATGANLVGSKTAATFSAASGRQKSLSAPVGISVPSADTVKWIGIWDSTGATFKGMYPNGGSDMSFQIGVTPNTVLSEAHGLVNDNRVVFHDGAPPTGLTEGTTYFVVGVSAGDPDTFQVAATQGGAAIDITGQHAAACKVSKIIEEVYGAAGTHTVNTLTISF